MKQSEQDAREIAEKLDVNLRHFHVCEECFHVWNHTLAESVIAGSTKAHRCPKCKAGPFKDGWRSLRSAMADAKSRRESHLQRKSPS